MNNLETLNRSFDEVVSYLNYIKSIGFKGFDSSDDLINIVKELDIIKFKSLPVEISCGDCNIQGEKIDGIGDKNSKIIFVCESPDDLTDLNSEASQLFSKMLNSIGISIDNVYITYLLKCKIPQDVIPSNREYKLCFSNIENEIKSISPSLICVLGSTATRVLMKKEGLVSDLRGHFIEFGRSILFPTFHPSYLLKNPAKKKEAWSDLKKLKEKLSDI